MSNLSLSLASLVKSNGGFFKSEKQAAFILSQKDDLLLDDSVSADPITIRGNTVIMVYVVDGKGVLEVKKYSAKKQTFTKTWERKIAGRKSMDEAKREKMLLRKIKQYKESISNRNAALDNGEYKGSMSLYDNSNKYDTDALIDHENALSELLSNI